MNKFLLLTPVLMLAASAQAAAPAVMMSRHQAFAERHKAPLLKAPGTNEIWRPVTEREFEWNSRGWEETSVITFTYDSEGRVLTNVTAPADENNWDDYTRLTNTYNANGMVTQRITETSADGATWTRTEIVERQYDPIVTNLIVSNRQGFWTGTEWNYNGNTYRRIIERNAAGSITSIEVQTMYLAGYEAVQRFNVKYGTDGRATEVVESVLTLDSSGQPAWSEGERYADIVWDRTDGQITSVGDLTSVDNRIKSATYWSDGQLIGPVTATYPDEKGSYTLTLDQPQYGLKSVESVEYIDDNGSLDYNLTTVSATEGTIISTEKHHYDAYGLEMLNYASQTVNGVEEIQGWIKGEAVYDVAAGYPTEYTLSSYEDNEWVKLGHSLFEDYINVAAGISDITGDSPAAETEYYDLRGIRIADPSQPGLYIRRQGNKTEKFIVR